MEVVGSLERRVLWGWNCCGLLMILGSIFISWAHSNCCTSVTVNVTACLLQRFRFFVLINFRIFVWCHNRIMITIVTIHSPRWLRWSLFVHCAGLLLINSSMMCHLFIVLICWGFWVSFFWTNHLRVHWTHFVDWLASLDISVLWV